MNRLPWFVMAAAGLASVAACRGGAEVKPSTPAAPAPGYERVPEVCREAQQRPDPAAAAPAPSSPDVLDSTVVGWNGDLVDLTARIVSVSPFLFEPIVLDPAHEDVTPFPFAPVELTAPAAAHLAGAHFGDIVTVRYRRPAIRNGTDRALVVAEVEPGPAPAAPPVPLLVSWAASDVWVRVYADGRAIVNLPEESPLELTLSRDELRALLGSFARAHFDALAAAPEGELPIAPGEIVLSCARRQRVRIAGREAALAPVLEALEALHDRAAARRSSVLLVEQSIPAVTVLDWPADAPPLADLQRLHEEAHAPGRKNGDPSPLFRPLPPAFAKAYAEGRAPGGKLVWLVRDHGLLWMIGDRGCAYGDPVCHPDSLDMVQVDLQVKPAPGWAPDFAGIGPDGLFYDREKDAPWLGLGGWYAQGDGLYLIEQRLRVPPAKP